MNSSEIIIIGAGAAGLMAARILAKAGKKVTVLEARNRVGGRIHTIDSNSGGKIELGAEFVHGDLPVTFELLKEAGIKYGPAGSDMWRYKNNRFLKEEEQMEGWEELMKSLKELDKDTDLNTFLERYFPGEKYEPMKASVRNFVSGYDTAEPGKASAFALREEWQNEDESTQHRLNDGYSAMINYLANEIRDNKGSIQLNSPVTTISWSPGKVEVITLNGEIFSSIKVLIALPLGILQLKKEKTGAIKFDPPIPVQQNAFEQIGFGAVIKILLKFKDVFWEHVDTQDMTDIGFLLSEEKIPTWWTQAPKHEPVLTGWLGGPAAMALVNASEYQLLDMALSSLSNIYKLSVEQLKENLTEYHIINWTADPYTRGSYVYDMVGSHMARGVLNKPVSDTIFFAGEYVYEGAAMGTVEAALTSGKIVVQDLI